MGKDTPWRGNSFNWGISGLCPPNIAQRSTGPMAFPAYTNPFGCAFATNATAAPFSRFAANNFFQMNSARTQPPNAARKAFLVFDQSGDQTNLIFSSAGCPLPDPNPISNPNSSDALREEEMHEDSEEIDALLYSDSEDDYYEEEEASTGHSPLETMTAGSVDEVASTSPAPAKRKRADASLADTASSAGARHWDAAAAAAESSCVGGRGDGEQGSPAVADPSHQSKRLKRERIQETVGVLRRIIPGGRGKGAAAVLDEAIRYLRSLQLKAKALGGAHSVATAS